MPEQQKHSYSTGDIVATRRTLRSPRADEGLIPKGTVGIVTGKSWDAWAHGDPHIRVNFGSYVKMVQPEWLQALDRPIHAPQGEPAPVYLFGDLLDVVEHVEHQDRELREIEQLLAQMKGTR